MFPLQSVLFPHMVLPLRVFEPRYRALAATCLAGTREFGVVLIERGSEVGGGDTRFGVGTVARIVRAEESPEGRYSIVAIGTDRFRVESWLADDPYPRALIDRLPLSRPSTPVDDPSAERLAEVAAQLRRVAMLRAGREVGAGVAGISDAAELVLDDDPQRAAYQLTIRAGLGALDAQRLLEIERTDERLDRLSKLITEEATLLEFLSGLGPSGPIRDS